MINGFATKITFTGNSLNLKSLEIVENDEEVEKKVSNFTLKFSLANSKVVNYKLFNDEEVIESGWSDTFLARAEKLINTTSEAGEDYFIPILLILIVVLLVILTCCIVILLLYRLYLVKHTNTYCVN